MSNINTNNINANYPIQGQDNNSQGFRTNFSAIKTALTVAKSEITTLETNTAKTNIDNNFNGNSLENILFNNTSSLFKNKGIPEDQQFLLDVKDALVFKVKFIGTNTLRFTNWPSNTTVAKCHSVRLHLQFELNPDDVNLLNYKINFSTDIGGEIKSYTTGAPWYYATNQGGWHLKPWRDINVSTDYNSYEHVFDAWSYNGGSTVFLEYRGSFV